MFMQLAPFGEFVPTPYEKLVPKDTANDSTQLQPSGKDSFQDAPSSDIVRAMLMTVSYLHINLHVYPAAWIIKNTNANFIHVFIRERQHYILVRVFVVTFLFTWLFPLACAYFVLPYDCGKIDYTIDEQHPQRIQLRQIEMHAMNCELVDYLRDPHKAYWPIGPALSATTLVLYLVIHFVFGLSRKLQRGILEHARPFLPNVFYNGLGPNRSDHSAYYLMKQKGLEKEWSWFHDSLGPANQVNLCIALSFTILAGFVIVGFRISGVAGATEALVGGFVIARIMLAILNTSWAFGATPDFIKFVDEQLHCFQPYKSVVDLSREGGANQTWEKFLKKDRLEKEVKKAVRIIIDQAEKTYNSKGRLPRPRWTRKEGDEEIESGIQVFKEVKIPCEAAVLAENIEKHGTKIIRSVAKWMIEHRDSLVCVQNVCWYLFESGRTFSSDMYGIASLSMMNIPLFLASCFDPDWIVLRNFAQYNAFIDTASSNFYCLCKPCAPLIQEYWTSELMLKRVYMGFPKQLLCERKVTNLTWCDSPVCTWAVLVDDFSNERNDLEKNASE